MAHCSWRHQGAKLRCRRCGFIRTHDSRGRDQRISAVSENFQWIDWRIRSSLLACIGFSGMINVHGSLLPRWRGASPIIYSVLNEDPVTGLTIMKIRPKHFDVGEVSRPEPLFERAMLLDLRKVLAQREVPVPPNVLMPELYTVMAKEGADLLTQCMQNLPECLRQAKPQSNENVSYGEWVNVWISRVSLSIFFLCKSSATCNRRHG